MDLKVNWKAHIAKLLPHVICPILSFHYIPAACGGARRDTYYVIFELPLPHVMCPFAPRRRRRGCNEMKEWDK